MKSKKKLAILVLITMINLSLSGCWNSREINSLAFVTSMGLDKTDSGFLLSVQFLNTRAIASAKSVNEAPVIVYTEEGNDLFEMIRKIVTHSPRKLNATHLQTIVFGEDFAKDGISGVLDFFAREHQIRTDMYFVVAKGTTANSILSSITKFESNSSAKIFSSLQASDKIWSATKSVKMLEILNSIISDGKNAVLTGVEVSADGKLEDNIDSLKITKADPLKIQGLAAFKKDKFIGWLNEDESKGYNFIIDNVSSTVGYVEDESIGKITLETTGEKVKTEAILIDGKPSINVNIEVTANIDNVEGNLDVTKEENLKKVEKLSAEKITQKCYKSLKRAQKDLGTDIFGFGEVIHKAYPKVWKTIKDNWNDEFINLPVNINVSFKIVGTGTITNSFFMKENK